MIGSIISGVQQIVQGGKMRKEAKKINPVYTPYERSRYASEMLGLARQQLNARDPYAAAQEQGLYTTQANTTAAIGRNATDSSQALAMLAGVQGQTQSGLFNIGLMNQQNYQQRLGNLNQAQMVNISEDDKVYSDKMAKYMMDMNRKTALENGARQNATGAASTIGQGIDNTIAMAANILTGGLAGGIGGGGGGGQRTSQYTPSVGSYYQQQPFQPRMPNLPSIGSLNNPLPRP